MRRTLNALARFFNTPDPRWEVARDRDEAYWAVESVESVETVDSADDNRRIRRENVSDDNVDE